MKGYAEKLKRAVIALHALLLVLLLVRMETLLDGLLLGLLLLPLPGLVAGRLRTYGWASMLIVFYCAFWLAEGVVAAEARSWPLIIATVCALDFSAMALFARLARREAPQAPPSQTAA